MDQSTSKKPLINIESLDKVLDENHNSVKLYHVVANPGPDSIDPAQKYE